MNQNVSGVLGWRQWRHGDGFAISFLGPIAGGRRGHVMLAVDIVERDVRWRELLSQSGHWPGPDQVIQHLTGERRGHELVPQADDSRWGGLNPFLGQMAVDARRDQS